VVVLYWIWPWARVHIHIDVAVDVDSDIDADEEDSCLINFSRAQTAVDDVVAAYRVEAVAAEYGEVEVALDVVLA
jgi:hypothetical protein